MHQSDISVDGGGSGSSGLLSEQSDREANECWLNRWVVTLPHWRGFAGDAMRTLGELWWDNCAGFLWAAFVAEMSICFPEAKRGV